MVKKSRGALLRSMQGLRRTHYRFKAYTKGPFQKWFESARSNRGAAGEFGHAHFAQLAPPRAPRRDVVVRLIV